MFTISHDLRTPRGHREILAVGILVLGCLLGGAPNTFAEDAPAAVEAVAPAATRGEWTISVGVGAIDYSESASIDDVDSDFSGTTVGVGIAYVYPLQRGMKLRAGIDTYASGQDTEEWREGGAVVQRNDLTVYGFGLRGAFGFDLLPASPAELNLWAGIGYRGQGFERENFRIFSGGGIDGSSVGTVEETYDIGGLTVAVEWKRDLSDRLGLRGEAGYEFVFFNEADNDAFGSIEGDGGAVWNVLVELTYSLNARSAVGAGIHATFQELDGDREEFLVQSQRQVFAQEIEWPDNETEHVSGHVYWRIAL